MQIPLTVAVLTYNRVGMLKESLESIRAQSYQDFELLILDNHSTDGTAEYVLSLSDPRIRYVRNPPNHAPEFNGYSAVKIARGKRILIFHDDDIMEQHMLKTAMSAFQANPSLTACWCNHSIINFHGELIQKNANPNLEQRIYQRMDYLHDFPNTTWWAYPSGLIFTNKYYWFYYNRYYYDKTHPTRTPNIAGGDPLTLITMNLKGPICIINTPLFRYRRHLAQETNQSNLSISALKLYKSLHRISSRYTSNNHTLSLYRNITARFEVQHLLINNTSFPLNNKTVLALIKISNKLNNEKELIHSSHHLYLIGILLNQLSLASDFIKETKENYNTTLIEAFSKWYAVRQKHRNLLDHLPLDTRIGILGTSMVGAMLLLEAKSSGFKNLLLLDSNEQRKGNRLLGSQIQHTTIISETDQRPDLLITSSEREQESSLFDLIQELAPGVETVSWKMLAQNKFSEITSERGLL